MSQGDFQKDKKEFVEEVLEKWFPSKSFAEETKREFKKETVEKREISSREKEEFERLLKDIESVAPSPQEKIEVLKEAEIVKRKKVEGQIRHLLILAQTKGVSFAIRTALKTNDPYLIDVFHDILASEGLFRKFPK